MADRAMLCAAAVTSRREMFNQTTQRVVIQRRSEEHPRLGRQPVEATGHAGHREQDVLARLPDIARLHAHHVHVAAVDLTAPRMRTGLPTV